MGPSAIRYAGLADRLQALGREAFDFGNVHADIAEAIAVQDTNVRFLPEVLATCERIAQIVRRALDEGQFPLVLGGDHSVALGSLGAVAAVAGPPGVLWLDAHGDVNRPETSPSGNVHGMVLAAALGLAGSAFESDAWPLPAVDPSRVALVGTRELDDGERELLHEQEIAVFTMTEVDKLGIEHAVRRSLERIAGDGFVHVSIDLDAVDPDVAPGVGTPVRGGLSYREAHLACELVAESGLAGSFDLVEVNPILDRENSTGRLAVELAASALGARLL